MDNEKNISKTTGSEIGSGHWYNTLMASIKHTGEYLMDNEPPSADILKAWGKLVYERSNELLEWFANKDRPAPLSEQKQEGETVEEAAGNYAYSQLRTEDKQDWSDNELHEGYTDEYFMMVDAYIEGQSQKTAKQIEESSAYFDLLKIEKIKVDNCEIENHNLRELIERGDKINSHQKEQIDQYKARIVALETENQKLINMLKYARNGYSTLIEYGILNDRYKDDAQVIIDKIESVL